MPQAHNCLSHLIMRKLKATSFRFWFGYYTRLSTMLPQDGSWTLPLPHDDPIQPLYRGPPLPLCVLQAVGINADPDGSYEKSSVANQQSMASACRLMAAWKLSGNGSDVSKFAARGGPKGTCSFISGPFIFSRVNCSISLLLIVLKLHESLCICTHICVLDLTSRVE